MNLTSIKKIALTAIASAPALAFAQDTQYTVQGKIGDYNAPAKVYVQYRNDGKTVVDSAILNGGAFKFTGKTSTTTPVSGYILFNPKGTGLHSSEDYRSIYLEPGTINVSATDKIADAKIEGTKTNNDNEKYNLAEKPINDAYEALSAKRKTATPEQMAELNAEEKKIDDQDAQVNKKFIQENPDSYVSLNALESYAYSADYVDIAPLFNNFSPAIKATEAGKKFAERLPKLKAVALGATAPEFAEADTAGKMVSLSSFRGKYVLIDFWASWCGPCRRENPNVVKAYNAYKGKNFTILGVSLDRPNAKDKWLAAIHKDGLTWNHVSDLKFWDSKAADLYAVRGIPQNFLLDPNGKIIGKNLRGEDLENKLAEIFGKI
ncbi:AhpC/TSA family protein [Mucilaginibacter rubeus]|uniref:AhpC/TSA family protein n=1 Tax=Mucilaginibacter rubeus TaxID=2027860 RepID=A0AAE6JKS1_9SPHI|nr:MULTISPECIES: TlpA disulfide reductase family protein [Mucilaginibacter]QEM07496.1 AhpC/TSA family protein [Mucilaginibacter rubeus]QEM19950.1 AhpC/TSA family protein [Mucilaginibacter gossypii]QTE43342.1 AhpC/TSA family protein [Mucilaginibacter rubeus]QTE49942.1 AhpC/TSA family protein [Mucilaginibacter rubeus]QTE55033.1 AhpC/TSA family protein [Mucilaginibacter rubeus]